MRSGCSGVLDNKLLIPEFNQRAKGNRCRIIIYEWVKVKKKNMQLRHLLLLISTDFLNSFKSWLEIKSINIALS